jgi:two-component sensor histidine kinase
MLGLEIDHRAKNLLAVVHASVQLTQAGTADELKKAISGRIQALSNAHTLLAESRWTGADLRRLVTEELSPFGPEGSRADVDGPDLRLEPQSAQSIAMVLHELTTNAVKYGALSVAAGRVRIEWSRADGGMLVLRWSETGGPPVKPPTRRGFGSRVVDQIIRTQLHGDARFDWRPDGLWCEIEFPAVGVA